MRDLDFTVTHFGHINYRKPNANWNIQNMANTDYYILACVEQGAAHYLINGKEVTLQPQDILFFQKGEPHTGRSDAEHPWSFYTIAFEMELHNSYTREFFQRFDTLHCNVNTIQYQYLVPKLYKTWMLQEDAYLVKCRSLLMDILYELIIAKSHVSLPPAHIKSINRVLSYIQNNSLKTHKVEHLAEIAGLSISYFRLLFKQATGYTATNYQNMLRLHYAHDLLQSGDCNVSEAAAAAGFSDLSYFSRMHRKIFGYAPSQSKLLENTIE